MAYEADADADEHAAHEHELQRLPFNTSLDEIEKRYGVGTRLYFDFLKYIILCNIVLFALGFVNWAFFMASDDSARSVMCNYPNTNFDARGSCNCSTPIICPTFRGVSRPLQFWEKLFINAWTPDQATSWSVISGISIACWFAFGPLYLLLTAVFFKPAADHDNIHELSGDDADRIPGNDKISVGGRILRRTFSTVVFVALIGGSATGIYFLQSWGTQDDVRTNFWLSLVVTVIIAGINLVWSFISAALVAFEKHRTWSSHRTHHIAKLYLFKIINVTVMYAALQWAFAAADTCPLQDLGVKFFLLIILDLFVMNVVEFVVPPLKTIVVRGFKCLRSEGSDSAELPEFDVAEEYLELLYRQFVLYIGMLTLPLLTLVALVTNFIEYPLDKFRMLKICQPPKRLNKPLTGFIVLFMCCSALAGFLSYPNGGLWMYLHLNGLEKCTIWANDIRDI